MGLVITLARRLADWTAPAPPSLEDERGFYRRFLRRWSGNLHDARGVLVETLLLALKPCDDAPVVRLRDHLTCASLSLGAGELSALLDVAARENPRHEGLRRGPWPRG